MSHLLDIAKQRIAEIAAQKKPVPDRDTLRQAMPVCTAWVDEMRTVFGADQVKVQYVRESDLEFGTRGPEGVAAIQISSKPESRKTT